jgi:RHS repeat-associated protein
MGVSTPGFFKDVNKLELLNGEVLIKEVVFQKTSQGWGTLCQEGLGMAGKVGESGIDQGGNMNSRGKLRAISMSRRRQHGQVFCLVLSIFICGALAHSALSESCTLHPIALSNASLSNAVPGVTELEILNGAGPGQFGWLSWSGSPSEAALALSLSVAGDGNSYVNPDAAEDRQVSIGDWVSSKPGVSNSKNVRDALDALKGVDITVPIWDANRGSGDKCAYRVSGFATVRLLGYQLPQQNRITARFIGFASCDQQNRAPSVDAGGDQAITLPASATLAGAVSDDGLPLGATVSVTWSQISGPGTTSFLDPHSTGTTATFSAPGTFVLRLTATDSQVTASDDLLITVDRENRAPLAYDQSVTTDEDVPVHITMTSSDLDGDLLVYVIVSQPAFGTLAGAPPNVVYTPGTDYNGIDELTFRVSDSQLDSGVATVTITNLPVNDAPVADAQSINTPEDTSVAVSLSGSDIEGSPLSYTIAIGPTNGTLSGLTPNITYTPTSNFHGVDSFAFRVNDGQQDSLPATVFLTVESMNDVPVVDAGTDQFVNLPANAVTLVGTVDDDHFFETNSLQTGWAVVNGPGSVVFADANSVSTTANFSSSGVYTLRLTASDWQLEDHDDVIITVNAGPTVDAGTSQTVNYPGSATLSGAASDDGIPTNSTLTVAWSKVSGPGAVHFVSTEATNTTASFSEGGVYVLRLSATDSAVEAFDETTVTVNKAPLVDAGSDQTVTNLSVTLSGLVTDDGIGAVTTVWSKVSGPGDALFSTNSANATVTFSAPGDYVLRLTADDGFAAGSDEVAVDVNSPPLAENQSAACDEDTALAIVLSATDADGDSLAYLVIHSPVHGTLDGVAPNLTYIPATNYSGPDSFEFRVNDGLVDSVVATVTITVRPVNDVPMAQGQSLTTLEDTAVALSPTGSDVDGDSLEYFVVTQPAHGVLSGAAPNFIYQPATNFNGLDSITFFVRDSVTNSSVATVFITVIPVNDPPTADAGPDLTLTQSQFQGANMLLNPGNEAALFGGNITNWVEVVGTAWTRALTNAAGFPPSLEGATYFYPGGAASAELRQDVSCAAYAAQIDGGVQAFQFKGYVRVKDEVRPDAAQIIVEYRDATNQTVLAQVFFPPSTESAGWRLCYDARTAPVGTRWIRVRLLGVRNLSDSLCDTYFDVLSLNASVTSLATLSGQASDDGTPTNAMLTTAWSQIAGPGQSHIVSSNALNSSVVLPSPGVYGFQIAADDGELTAADTMQITVQPPAGNQPPLVLAGADRFITLPTNSVVLSGTVTDDGLPTNGVLRVSWAKVSGEGEVVFENPNARTTTAYFDRAGTYMLRLSADDGALVAGDELVVNVECASVPAPMDVALVIDQSGSMIGEPMSNAKLAAIAFVDTVIPLKDLVWIIPFDDNAQVVAGPIVNRAKMQGTLATIEVDGGTAIDVGLQAAYQSITMQGRTNFAHPLIILLSDGQSSITAATNMAAQAKAAGIRIITVGLGTGVDDKLMKAVASSRADYHFVPNATNLPALFERLALSICRSAYDNAPPLVEAGPAGSLNDTNGVWQLQGAATDDGLPPGALLNVRWTKLSGPGEALFADASALNTSVSFTQPGDYVLLLTVDDSFDSGSDGVRIRVGMPCQVVADDSLVAWWNLDGTVRDGFRDFVLNGDGWFYYIPRYDLGKVGAALRFDGSVDYLRAPATTNLDLATSAAGFTIEFWAKPDATLSRYLMGWTNNGVRMEQINSGTSLRLHMGNAVIVDAANVWSTANLNWAHVAVTYDRTAGVARIYVNGARAASANMGTNSFHTTGDFFMGWLPGQENYYAGLLDEMSLYRRPLNAQEVYEIFASGSVGKCPSDDNEPPLIYAGPDAFVTGEPRAMMLEGSAVDDGLPAEGTLHTSWRKFSGPGAVTFGDTNELITSATFSTNGIYVLQLTVDDGSIRRSDLVEVRVESLCAVEDPNGLAAWLPGNGTTEDVLSGNEGLLASGTSYVEGKVAGAFQFDGTNDFLQLPATTDSDLSASAAGFTLEWWMKPSSTQNGYVLGWANGVRLEKYNSTSGGIRAYLAGPTTGLLTNGLWSASSLNWTHVAVTYDRASGVGRIYINGVPGNSVSVGTNLLSTTGDFYLGQVPGSTGHYNGLLDEVSLYRRPLNAQEVYEVYASGSVGKCPSDDNQAPSVYAGMDTFVAGVPHMTILQGEAYDDGLPTDTALRTHWSQFSGPGAVTFGDANALSTSASFSSNGIYVLQLTADDGSIQRSDLVEVRVESLCTVEDPDGLAAWLPGNGTTEDVLSGNEGLLASGTSYVEGKVAGAFRFDGTNDYVQLPTTSDYDLRSSAAGFTLEWWMKPNSTQTGYVMGWASGVRVEKYNSANGALRVYLAGPTSGLLSGSLWGSSSFSWTHVTVTYERATGMGRIYANGVLTGTSAVGTNILSTSGDFYLGLVPGSAGCYNGLLDEVSLYRRPLNAQEVYEVFASGSVGKCPNDDNQPPMVYAGADFAQANLMDTAVLNGTAADDGLPAGSMLRTSWSVFSGPGAVNFGDTNALITTATFSTNGIYVLQLTADDGSIQRQDLVEIRAAVPCSVSDIAGLSAWLPGNGTSEDILSGKTDVLAGGTSYLAGKVAAAFRFDGTNDYVQLAAGTNYDVGTSASGFTIELWMKPNATLNGFVMGWTNGVRLEKYNSTIGALRVFVAGTGSLTTSTLWTGSSLNWTHVAVTYDRAAGVARIFTNGVQATSASVGTNVLTTAGDLYLGQVPGNVGFFNGLLDEVSLYSRPLAAVEVQSIFSAGASGKCMSPRNTPPIVSAGPDRTIYLPTNSVTLNGSAIDDGLPAGSALTVGWSYLNGPGTVFFTSTNTPVTTITFTNTGAYIFSLNATDGQLATDDAVTVTVLPDPRVAPTITLTSPINGSAFEVASGGTTDLGAVASVSDADGFVTNVTFLLNGVPVGTRTAAPWSVTVSNLSTATYTFTAIAADNSGLSSTSAPVQVAVYVDQGPPLAELVLPEDAALITAPTNIIGTASSPILQSYTVRYRLKAPENTTAFAWTTFGSGTTSVVSNTLATFDPTLLLNGIYELQLAATDKLGRTSLSEINTLIVDRNLKIGHFTLSFNDLSIPVPGLPIQVTRTYDSRAAAAGIQGDFGVGWLLDIRNVRLQKNRSLSANWEESTTGSPYDLSIAYHLTPRKSRIVTITFPDGRVEKFQFVPNPVSQALLPIDYPQWRFVPIGNTRGTLVPAGYDEPDGKFLYFAGSIPGTADLHDLNGYYDWINFDLTDAELARYPTLFRFTSAEGYRYLIDEIKGLQSMTDPNGNTLLVGTNGLTWTNTTTGGSSLSIAFKRDFQGRITNIVDAAGHAMGYRYSTNGNLAAFTDRAGQTNDFAYTNAAFPHHLTAIVDARGVTPMNAEYDNSGRLVRNADVYGNAITYFHDVTNLTTSVTDRNGYPLTQEFDDAGNLMRAVDALGGVTTCTYDSEGRRLSRTNPLGETENYVYNPANGALIALINALGQTNTFTYNTNGQVIRATERDGAPLWTDYDSHNNVTRIVDTLGNETVYTYNTLGKAVYSRDALSNEVRSAYDNFGNLSRAINALGNVSTFAYDANNRITSQVVTRTVNGVTETQTNGWAYDSLGRVTEAVAPDGTTHRTIYDASGHVAATIDQLGSATTNRYDLLGRLVQVVYPDGSSEGIGYDAADRKIANTNRLGQVTRYFYDALNRPVVTIFPDGTGTTNYYNAGSRLVATMDARGKGSWFGHDSLGRVIATTNALREVTLFSYDARGNQVTSTDALGHTTTNVFDLANRLVSVVYPDGTTTSNRYDALGCKTADIDQLGRVTSYGYDALGRLTAVTNALLQVTRYEYNELGEQTAQIDASGHITRYEYDVLGRRVSRILPLGQADLATYDDVGNLTSYRDFNGNVTGYQYDNFNRLIQKTPDPRLGEPSVSFGYNTLGQRTNMVDANGMTTYRYDTRNRLIEKATPQGTLTYTYDNNGNVASIRSLNANGAFVTYEHDALNRLSAVNDANLGRTTYTYDVVGNLLGFTTPNGVTTYHSYDSLNRLTNVTGTKLTTSLASYTYAVAANGQRTAVTELSGRVVNYSYDLLNRLTNETVTGAANYGTATYDYDAVGNRLARNSSLPGILAATYSYDANDRLTSDNYDANGNTRTAAMRDPLSPATHTVSDQYDFENRLVDRDGGRIRVVYDGDGNRVRKTVTTSTNTVTTYYLVDELNPTGYPQVLEEHVSIDYQPATLNCTYTWGHALLSQDRLTGVTWAESYYGFDGQGSVRYLTDGAGNVTDSYDYDAFGNLTSWTGTTVNTYRYQGEQYDEDLRLYYLRARYADPDRGRFWTMDSFEGFGSDPASLHKYSFNHNDPVNRRDPSGHFSLAEQQTVVTLAPTVRGSLQALQQSMLMCRMQSAAMAGLVGGGIGGTVNVYITRIIQAFTGEFDRGELMKAFSEGFADGFMAGFAMGFSPFTAAAYMGYSAFMAGTDFWKNFNDPNVPLWQKYIEGATMVASLAALAPSVARKLNMLLQKFCFPAGTEVATADGQKLIEQIREGDLVWAQDDRTGEVSLKPVQRLFVNVATALVVLQCGTNTLEATSEHPLWVVDEGWKAAGQVQIGDALWSRTGERVTVTAIGHKQGQFTVYNFEVGDFHSYFVGADEVLGHNACDRWQFYQSKIANLYKGLKSAPARWVDGDGNLHIADNVAIINGKRTAIEAKLVQGPWDKSLRNPASESGQMFFGVGEQQKMLSQAKAYSAEFEEVIYHSNSQRLIDHYDSVFKANGINNIKWMLTHE